MKQLWISALTAAVMGAASALCTELPAAAVLPASVHACTGSCAAGAPTAGPMPRWVADPSAPGEVTIDGTGVDCDPRGCFIPGGNASWSQMLELQAVAGYYAADPPTAAPGN